MCRAGGLAVCQEFYSRRTPGRFQRISHNESTIFRYKQHTTGRFDSVSNNKSMILRYGISKYAWTSKGPKSTGPKTVDCMLLFQVLWRSAYRRGGDITTAIVATCSLTGAQYI